MSIVKKDMKKRNSAIGQYDDLRKEIINLIKKEQRFDYVNPIESHKIVENSIERFLKNSA